MSDNDSERRSRLLSVKLVALVRAHTGRDTDSYRIEPCAVGAALVSDLSIWVLIDGDASRQMGPSLAWALRAMGGKSPVDIHLVAEENAGLLARRADQFRLPLHIWTTVGSEMRPADKTPFPEVHQSGKDSVEFAHVISTAGAEALVEHGVVVGEVRGLEICRVIADPDTGKRRLEVGIGAHDREAFAMVHGEKPTHDAIVSVVDAVMAHRFVDAPFHPYNHLAAERFARWRAVQTPEIIGFHALHSVDPPVRRVNVKDAVPCVAKGVTLEGRDCIAVFVHGIDLDVVPFAVDAAAMHGLDAVTIVSRPQDITSSVRALAAACIPDVTFVPFG